MRILHLVHQYAPEHIGGTELYTQWLSQGQSQRGHQVTIFYRRSAEGAGIEHRMEEGTHVWAAWAGALSPTRRFRATFGDPAIVRSFERALEEATPDLIHIQHLMGLPARLVPVIQQRRIPFVITLWDFWWVCANAQLLTNYSQEICDGPRAYLNCARCALARANASPFWPALPGAAALLAQRNQLLRRIMEAADRLIAPTEFVRRWYAQHKTPREKIIVALPGLDVPTLSSPDRQRPDGAVRFAYIGGHSWQKGVHVLLEAFKDVESGGELWIAGDETADPAYVTRLRSLATSNVRFLGRLARAEVWKTLSQVDVVVVPSMWYETFSFLVSEAFAAGVPVIASRLGPLADRVSHGVDGLLVPPGDVQALRNALLQLVEDPALLTRLHAGIQPVPTIEDHVRNVEAIYEAATARPA